MLQYAYFGRVRAGKHAGILCFGYEIKGKAVEYSMAFCSPKDNFSKKLAHTIIQGRFRKGKKLRVILPSRENLLNWEILGVIVNDYNTTSPAATLGVQLPRWAAKDRLYLVNNPREKFSEEKGVK